ncbi:MAG: hypothetical protein KAI99_01655 [Cyclobacteriaceae bacterium]|nr:hypothetical protein [Cyclobacteriaceae bacterium]
MATVNFYLDRADRFEKYQIFMVYQHKGTKLKFIQKKGQIRKHGIQLNNGLKEIMPVTWK